MKRLVTQFDTERTRSTVSTPTCCCCCCCCVGSVLSATALATIDAYDAASRAGVAAGRRWLYGLAAFSALPLALLASGTAGWLVSLVSAYFPFLAATAAFYGVWIAVLVMIHGRLQSPKIAKSVSLTVIFPSILFGLEFGIGAALITEGGGGGGVLYLVMAAVMPFVVVPLLLAWIRSSA